MRLVGRPWAAVSGTCAWAALVLWWEARRAHAVRKAEGPFLSVPKILFGTTGEDDEDYEYGEVVSGEVPRPPSGASRRRGGGARRRRAPFEERFDPERVRTEAVGKVGQEGYRRFFHDSRRGPISPWHDIPWKAVGAPADAWMVTEMPKRTSAKYGILLNERMNPVAPSLEHGQPRQYTQTILWNCGFLPQTWEDPSAVHPELQLRGDNRPLDIVELGSQQYDRGKVSHVRILGALAMIRQGELDWKILAVDVEDELASHAQNISDLEAHDPELLGALRDWLASNEGVHRRLNDFAFGGSAVGQEEALAIIEAAHDAWRRLRREGSDAFWLGDEVSDASDATSATRPATTSRTSSSTEALPEAPSEEDVRALRAPPGFEGVAPDDFAAPPELRPPPGFASNAAAGVPLPTDAEPWGPPDPKPEALRPPPGFPALGPLPQGDAPPSLGLGEADGHHSGCPLARAAREAAALPP